MRTCVFKSKHLNGMNYIYIIYVCNALFLFLIAIFMYMIEDLITYFPNGTHLRVKGDTVNKNTRITGITRNLYMNLHFPLCCISG